VRPDPTIKGNDCAVEIDMADGQRLAARCEHPRGSPKNPLTRGQVESKFRTYAKGILPDAQAEAAVAAVNRLENLGSVRELMDMLRGKAQKARAA
jgi:2-methylcitrate dehydratase